MQDLRKCQPVLWALPGHKNASCGLINPGFGLGEQLAVCRPHNTMELDETFSERQCLFEIMTQLVSWSTRYCELFHVGTVCFNMSMTSGRNQDQTADFLIFVLQPSRSHTLVKVFISTQTQGDKLGINRCSSPSVQRGCLLVKLLGTSLWIIQ